MKTRTGVAVLMAVIAWVAAAESDTYRVVSDESELVVHVGRSGIFKMFGHDHRIRTGRIAGTVRWNEGSPESSELVIEIDAGSLVVADEEISDEDRAEVQATMESEALAVSDHPQMTFTSSRVELEYEEPNGGAQRLNVVGELFLRGVRGELEVPVTLVPDSENGRLLGRGAFELESQEWGVPQISVAGGTVKTKSELKVEFEIVAVRERN